MTPYAVLSGDLIASSKLSAAQIDAALFAIRTATGHISNWQPGLSTGFGRRGGDGWQLALSYPRLDLRAALYIRASLRILGKGYSTRIALMRGEGTLPANGDANSASGPAFVGSGRLLDTISGSHSTMIHGITGPLAATTRLADHISQSWTPAQARALQEMLPPNPGTHAEAAANLGISRQAVDQALTAAGYHALSDALTAIEEEAKPE